MFAIFNYFTCCIYSYSFNKDILLFRLFVSYLVENNLQYFLFWNYFRMSFNDFLYIFVTVK